MKPKPLEEPISESIKRIIQKIENEQAPQKEKSLEDVLFNGGEYYGGTNIKE